MANYEFVTLVFSGIVALSTVVYSILTWKLVKESRLTREFQNTPDISIYFKRAEADVSFIYIVFENTGSGFAKNVRFEIIKNFGFYDNKLFDLALKGIILNGKENFYSKQRFEYFFTDLSQEHQAKIKDNITLKINYSNIYGKRYERKINLELKELLGVSITNPPTNYAGRIAYELKEIKNILKNNKN
ncbi:hypothetical protein [Albibacterium bauzanense]|uniref:Uncharacterized protein n=1 Tax=Albibacterium bauzanense TaxID=653929 RepID=A0A4R1M0T5_9SPHI|nr:hypothetical protein [Albibacterium bauzanense]TCK83139.1 hypothetical protein C8N28_1729 [Albibacterium bauzanense]